MNRIRQEQMMEEGWTASYVGLDKPSNPKELDIPQGKLEINEASEAEKRIADALERIANTLDRIAPYFEERTIQR